MKIAALLFMMLLVSGIANAEFYKYKDSSGALVITDKLENVPKKYRNQLKVVWDEDLEKKDSLARRKAAAKAQQEKLEQEEKLQKPVLAKKADKEKQVVITVDEQTGEIKRTLE